MPDHLLAIKLYPPSLRPNSVDRPRLVDKMNQGLETRAGLTLVSAPAGYGKTTLVREWLSSLGRREEGDMITEFGQQYRDYQQRTGMFLPRLLPARPVRPAPRAQ